MLPVPTAGVRNAYSSWTWPIRSRGSSAGCIPIDLAQRVSASAAHHRSVPDLNEDIENKAKPSRLDEVRRAIEEYAADLREVIRRLRQKMN